MNLVVKRKHLTKNSTAGELWIDGSFFCYTLEDVVHDGPKKPGETAIPAGTYDVTITWSPRFRRLLPILHNVPGFEGVRIHSGNTPKDTEGCILVGDLPTKDFVANSRDTFAKLFLKLQAEKEITISIVEEFEHANSAGMAT